MTLDTCQQTEERPCKYFSLAPLPVGNTKNEDGSCCNAKSPSPITLCIPLIDLELISLR